MMNPFKTASKLFNRRLLTLKTSDPNKRFNIAKVSGGLYRALVETCCKALTIINGV